MGQYESVIINIDALLKRGHVDVALHEHKTVQDEVQHHAHSQSSPTTILSAISGGHNSKNLDIRGSNIHDSQPSTFKREMQSGGSGEVNLNGNEYLGDVAWGLRTGYDCAYASFCG